MTKTRTHDAQRKVKQVRAWAVVDARSYLWDEYIGRTRKWTIKRWCAELADGWDGSRKLGYRIIPVEIRPIQRKARKK